MPVVGHALTGVVIAQLFEPNGVPPPTRLASIARALWLPLIVALSYLPDFVALAAVWLDYEFAQAIGHSIPLGLVVGAAVGAAWARAMDGSFARAGRMAALATGVIVLHDVLDLLQDHERMPFWPLSTREIGVDWLMMPNRLAAELVVFGLPFVLFEAWRFVTRRGRASAAPVLRPSRPLIWLGRGLVVVLIVASIGMLYLREERRREMAEARELVWSGKAQEGLAAIERAERWPSSPGAGDLHRGEAYDRLGDRARAEAALLRAVERDDDNFWPLAVLAAHYASHGSSEERQWRSAPYIEELRRRFADHDALERVLESIDRQLQKGH